MNWKEFKDYVESKGITDEMPLEWIDITVDDPEEMDVKKWDDGTFTIDC